MLAVPAEAYESHTVAGNLQLLWREAIVAEVGMGALSEALPM